MIIVRLTGGLGNQMFQYAFGRAMAHRYSTELKLDTSSFPERTATDNGYVERNYDLDVFTVEPEFATSSEVALLSKRSSVRLLDRVMNKALGFKSSVVLEPHFHFSNSVAYETNGDRYMIGYWQSPKYFEEIEPVIRDEFRFREPLAADAAELRERIENANSVCLNVRRGDFVVNPFHGSLGVDYFQTADRMLGERLLEREYFVFSDDVEWCKANLRFDVPTTFVSHSYAGRKFQDYLRLMSSCKHFVIPNSSFAWWAVWLNKSSDRIVVAPKEWFSDSSYNTSDLIPDDWIRI